MAYFVAVPPNFNALKKTASSLQPITELSGVPYSSVVKDFRSPLSSGFRRRLCREGFQPMAPRSLGQAQRLLVPVNAFVSFVVSRCPLYGTSGIIIEDGRPMSRYGSALTGDRSTTCQGLRTRLEPTGPKGGGLKTRNKPSFSSCTHTCHRHPRRSGTRQRKRLHRGPVHQRKDKRSYRDAGTRASPWPENHHR